MKILEDMNACTGCGACLNSCPKSAISMKINEEGFKYPEIDADKCINCGLCAKSCPVNGAIYDNEMQPQCYAVQGSDELRAISSSGGAFSFLAEYILQQKGVVCGAAFRSDFTVEHIIVDNIDDLKKLRGSKYMQSDIGTCYKQIKNYLAKEILVLFSGTPCQIAGLKSFLGKNYDNLYCVDIICHGVPSAELFKRSLKEQFGDEKIVGFNFRDKTLGWKSSHVLEIDTDKSSYHLEAGKFPYMVAFLSNLCLRKCCGNCRFNRLPRQGDITIGDFWRVEKYKAKLNDGKGTSALLVNNEKGKKIFEAIKKNFKLCQKAPLQKIIDGNPNLIGSSKHNAWRTKFFAQLDKISLQENVEYAAKQKYDAAILNFWPYSNFGAILTGYALQKSLEELGYENRLIWYMNKANIKHYAETFISSHFKDFADKYIKYTPLLDYLDLQKLNEHTSCFIAGSDQIWRTTIQGENPNAYYLDFAGDKAKKIACAASFGLDNYIGTETQALEAAYYLQQFDAVSVREYEGQTICREKMGVNAEVLIDPVFYINRKYFDQMADSVEINLPKKYILAYFLGMREDDKKVVDYYAQKYGLPVVYLNIQDMTTEEWLAYIRNAKLLITNSFHGVCFSIIFNNDFICVADKNKAYSRFTTVLKKLNLLFRARTAEEIVSSGKYDFDKIDYNLVNPIIEKEKNYALQWLKNAMEMDVKPRSVSDLMINHLQKDLMIKEQELISICSEFNYPKYLHKYRKYKLLSKITWGNARKKYKEKRKMYKQKVKTIRKMLKTIEKEDRWL